MARDEDDEADELLRRKLKDLLGLAGAGELAALRMAVGELDREEVGELLLTAVLCVVSLEAAGSIEAEPVPAEPDDAEELPADPWSDPTRPYSSALDQARQLRAALLDQPDLPSLLNAVGALSPAEHELIVMELALDAWWTRTQRGGAAG
jgi:hypothetical protein